MGLHTQQDRLMNTAKRSAVTEPAPPVARLVTRIITGLAVIPFIGSVIFVSVTPLLPPDPVSSNAAPTEFSSARAMKHLTAISQSPHPTGSPAQTEVRNYILSQLVALGLKPEVQEATSISNIVARLKGTQNGKAVLLDGHYDTVAEAPGASDDGAAVAMMIETIRALKSRPPLNNDVIFLFSDGEELGRLGASAFVYQHPWAKDVGLVLNFEARGVKGPSILFETSSENGRMIREFAKAAQHPVANSFAYDVYKFLPNDTDLTVFKEAGFAGLNFAFIDGSQYYHTANDNLANLDERSLQHHGSYALALTENFANLDLANLKASDVIYFNLFGSTMIVYPVRMAIPFAGLAIFIFLGYAGFALRNRRLAMKGVASGFGALLLSIAISCLLVTLIRWIGEVLSRSPGSHDRVLLGISVSAIVVVTSIVYLRSGKTASTIEMAIGGSCGWLVMTVLTSLFLKGSSYLFVWPLIFNTLALAAVLRQPLPAHRLPLRLLVISICAIPTIVLISSFVYLMFLALTIDSLSFSIVAASSVALTVVPFLPHLRFVATGVVD
jgi:Peptidase family M28